MNIIILDLVGGTLIGTGCLFIALANVGDVNKCFNVVGTMCLFITLLRIFTKVWARG